MRLPILLYMLIAFVPITFFPGPVTARTVLVLGDSISAAYGLDESQGWVSLLQEKLQQNDPDIKVVNASISGETTNGGLQRLPAAIERFAPDLLILELGGNDGLRGQSLKIMKRNLKAMVNLARSAGAKPLLLGMRIPSNYGAFYTDRFFEVFQIVADETQSAIVPFLLEPIATNREYFQADGVHPTAEAQPLMMLQVLEQVQTLLQPEAVSE